MELRERIADMLRQYFNWSPDAVLDARASALVLADAILAIPEIAEALGNVRNQYMAGYNDGANGVPLLG